MRVGPRFVCLALFGPLLGCDRSLPTELQESTQPLPQVSAAPTSTPIPGSVTVQSIGDFEIYTWMTTDGASYRVEDRYDAFDRWIKRTYYINGNKAGEIYPNVPSQSLDHDVIAVTEDWSHHDAAFNIVQSSIEPPNRHCIDEFTCVEDPLSLDSAGTQLMFQHPCNQAMVAFMESTVALTAGTVAMGFHTRRRMHGPSGEALSLWSGTVAIWWGRMWILDHCLKDHGTGRRPRPPCHYCV